MSDEVAYILLKVRHDVVDAALAQLRALPFVKEAALVIGAYDIIVKVEHEETFNGAYQVLQEIWKVNGIKEDHVLPVIMGR